MAPLTRVVALGLPDHGTTRGNRRRQTFLGDEDYREGGDWPVPADRPTGNHPDREPSAPHRRAFVPRAWRLPGPRPYFCRAENGLRENRWASWPRARLRLIDQDTAKSLGSVRPDDPGWRPAEAGASDRHPRNERRARPGAQSRLAGLRAAGVRVQDNRREIRGF
jgi:hypothetical protein